MDPVAFALPTAARWTRPTRPSALADRGFLLVVVTVLGVLTATWGLVMALSPVLQIRQMWVRQSSEDVSVGFFAVLLPGFALWITYGTVRSDWVVVIPNVVALLVGAVTIAVAMLLRRRRRTG